MSWPGPSTNTLDKPNLHHVHYFGRCKYSPTAIRPCRTVPKLGTEQCCMGASRWGYSTVSTALRRYPLHLHTRTVSGEVVPVAVFARVVSELLGSVGKWR